MNAPCLPPFAGCAFEVAYEGLTAINAYAADSLILRYEITEGALRGARGEVHYQWREIIPDIYAISWQEADGATVVHIDDFALGTSQSFLTTRELDLYRLSGALRPLGGS